VKESSICVLPWNQISVASDGTMRICCNSYAPTLHERGQAIQISEYQTIDFVNTPELKEIRLQMLVGKKPEKCARCWDQEKTGQESFRKMLNGHFPEAYQRILNGDHAFQLEYLSLDFGNKCNLACKMCSPGSSSFLAKEQSQAEGFLSDYEVKFAQEVLRKSSEMEWYQKENFWIAIRPHLKSLKRLFIIGGEPFIIDAHLRLLEDILEYGKPEEVEIFYNSNMTIVPKRLMEVWEKFKVIFVNASIDGTGEYYDYIRWPASFGKVESNLRELYLAKKSNVRIVIHSTIQALNLVNIVDLVQRFDPIPFFFIPLHAPNYLHVGILPKEIIEKTILDFENLTAAGKLNSDTLLFLKSGIQFLKDALKAYNEDSQLRRQFLKSMKWYDARRNQSLLKIHPYFGTKKYQDLLKEKMHE